MTLFRGTVAESDQVAMNVGKAAVPGSLRPVDRVSYMWYRRVIDCRVRLNVIGDCLERVMDQKGVYGVRLPTGEEVRLAVKMFQLSDYRGRGVVEQVDDGSSIADDVAALRSMSRQIRTARRKDCRYTMWRCVRSALVDPVMWWRCRRRR